jgi:hypothetical protein
MGWDFWDGILVCFGFLELSAPLGGLLILFLKSEGLLMAIPVGK